MLHDAKALGSNECSCLQTRHTIVESVHRLFCYMIINPRRACAARVTVLSLSACACVCESVTSLTATPLTHRYKGRYESKANAVLKVFDSWISLKILCTALFAHPNEL